MTITKCLKELLFKTVIVFLSIGLWLLFFTLMRSIANAEDCAAGFKTQDYVEYAAGTPRFTILIPDRTTTPSCNGMTGITFATTGLYVSLRVDNQPTVTTYTSAGSTIQDIAQLGQYMQPTSGKIRLKLVNNTSQPGVLEIQPARSFFNVPNSRRVDICVGGITNAPSPICEKIYIKQPHCGFSGCS